jgi:amino acid adenylation domain-containing protein
MKKDIAIIGMSGRFPGADNLDQLVDILEQGKDTIGKISPKRLKDTTLPPEAQYKERGYLEDIDKFDYDYFKISAGEARDMCPELRLMLEAVHEAIENAGYAVDELAGSDTAVFMAEVPNSSYRQHADEFSETLLTGNLQDYMSARISRQFKLEGPSTMINTSCSSSLAAVYFACNELILDNASSALVCGVNLSLFPFEGQVISNLESPDGISRAFSADANGMSFGEMAAAVWLKPLEQAIVDNDNIHAVIKGIAVNNNADRSSSPMAPDSRMQARVIRKAWEKAGVQPSDIGYIEAHGSGTQLGDSLEIEGLNTAFRDFYKNANPLKNTTITKIITKIPISTLKSNLGHGRSGSGLAGLIKTALSLNRRTIYPTIHFDKPSHIIDFENAVVEVNTQLKKWDQDNGKPRYGGTSSIGASGINCHAVLTEPPLRKHRTQLSENNKYHLVTVSSKTKSGLLNNLRALNCKLNRNKDVQIADIAFTLNRGRIHHPYRFTAIADSIGQLIEQFEKAMESPTSKLEGETIPPELKNLIFIFSDHNEVPQEMVKAMETRYPVFREHYRQCLQISKVPKDLRTIDFAFQYSFYQQLRHYGITTTQTLSIGIGRIVYDVITGAISLNAGLTSLEEYQEETIENLDARVGKLIQAKTGKKPTAFIDMGIKGQLPTAIAQKKTRQSNYYVFSPNPETQDGPITDTPLLILLDNLYRAGFKLDFKKIHQNGEGRKIELPGYQFEKTRCWLRDEPKPIEKPHPIHAAEPETPKPLLVETGNSIQEKIAEFWADTLEIKQYALDDDFFDIGGDSLKTTRIINRLNKEFSLDLSFEDMFDFPTIRSMSYYIEKQWGTEQKLAAMWKQVLKCEQVKSTDSFFQLGGHSLMANKILLKIKKQFRLELDFEDFFSNPTLEEQARLVETRLAHEVAGSEQIHLEPTETRDYYPVSFAQKRMYLLQHFDPQGIVYNNLQVFPLDMELDRAQLEAAFKKMIQRHESLRTSFHTIDDQPFQRIHSPGEIEFSIEQHEVSTAEVGEKIKAHVKPFDLSSPPLLRAQLLKLEEPKYLLLLDTHHIITDGTSARLMMEELIAHYENREMPQLTVQYKDFSEWQHREMKDGKMQPQVEYWLKQFGEEPPVLELPTDYPRPAVKSFEGRILKFSIPPGETGLLKSMALKEETTLFMVLLTAFNILLSKISGQEDIVVGIPIAGRRHDALEKLIGMFVNTLALRNYPAADKTASDVLQDVKTRTLAAFKNQDYPFEDLVDKVAENRDAARNPLFDVMFVLQNFSAPSTTTYNRQASASKNQLQQFDSDTNVSRFDITLIGIEKQGTLHFTIEYGTRLFKEETIQRIVEYFRQIIRELPHNTDRYISDIEILPKEEKRRILEKFNQTKVDYPKDKTIHCLFEEQTARRPNAVAVLGPTNSHRETPAHISQVTYGELNGKAEALAQSLRREGVGPDIIVGFEAERSIDTLIIILGILKAGGAFMPIDPGYPEERIQYMLEDSRAAMLSMDHRLYGLELKSTKPAKPAEPVNLAYIIYTSGSTGRPKGVAVEHRSLVNGVTWQSNYYNITGADHTTQYASLSFDASILEIFPCQIKGALLHIIDEEIRYDTGSLNRYYESHDITFSFLPTQVAEQFMEQENRSLRVLLVAGDKLNLYRKQNYRLFNNYGPTENTVVATSFEVDDNYRNIPIGKPVDNNQIYILNPSIHNPDALQLQPIGVPGEICIAGESLSRGYLNNPELTAERFVACESRNLGLNLRVYRTGDRARLLQDGNIEFLGRIDRQVKIRGYRIETGEIARQLLNHDKIKEAWITPWTEKNGNKSLCAYVSVNGDDDGIPQPLDEELKEELKEYLAKVLPTYMIPTHIIRLAQLPMTTGGKVDTRALPEPAAGSGDNYTAPRNGIETRLIEIWNDVLSNATQSETETIIGIDNNFFEMGGHSLNAAAMLAKVHKALNVSIPLHRLFLGPTVRELARYIKGTAGQQFEGIENTEKKEYYILSSAQKRMFLYQQMERNSILYNMPQAIPLTGKMDVQALQDVFTRLIRRHESLRTSFHVINHQPVQKVHDMQDIHFAPEASRNFSRADFVRPFDLSQAPLLRVGILLVKNTPVQMVVDMHHIISDGTSMGILAAEFLQLVENKEMKPLRLQYKDYAEWQHSKPQQETLGRQEHYWLKRFEGGVPRINLPTDKQRGPVQQIEAGNHTFFIGPELTDPIKQLTAKEDVTQYMLLMTIFKILLHQVTGSNDIVVGVPVSGRSHADQQNMIGMFVNMLVLYNKIDDRMTFLELLQNVKKNMLDAYENQDYQFDDLVARLQPERDPGRHQLFDVVLTYVDNILPSAGGKSQPQEKEEETPSKSLSVFDLNLNVSGRDDFISFTIEYAASLFNHATVVEMGRYYRAITEQVMKNTGIKIKDIVLTQHKKAANTLIDDEGDFGF